MRILSLGVLLALQLLPRPADIPFRIHPVDVGASETAAVADINKDGRFDVISGEYWYEAPAATKHRFREVGFSGNYIDSFSLMPIDVDLDGYTDLVDVSWFAKKIAWWRNPGRGAGDALWKESPINACCNIEFAVMADVDNDGKALEIVAQENGTGQSWYEARAGVWVTHVISDRSYGHGIGVGDVNGDRRNDILTPRGWLEAPLDVRAPGAWTFHNDWEAINTPIAGAGRPPLVPGANGPGLLELGFMHTADIDGDGRRDVIAGAGHNFGVFWFQHPSTPLGAGPSTALGAEGAGQWTRRVIDNSWSQAHASTLVDLNGDGRLDVVTGKRFMAHNGSDPGEGEPLGLYWYESRRAGQGVEWIRHVISYGGQIGAGMQVTVIDLDADTDFDIVVGGKSGLFILENLTRTGRR